jgi:hypothetical protein
MGNTAVAIPLAPGEEVACVCEQGRSDAVGQDDRC